MFSSTEKVALGRAKSNENSTEVEKVADGATKKMADADDEVDATSRVEVTTGVGLAVEGTPPAFAAPGTAIRPVGLAAVGSGAALNSLWVIGIERIDRLTHLMPQAMAIYSFMLAKVDAGTTTGPHLSRPKVPPLKPQLFLHFS